MKKLALLFCLWLALLCVLCACQKESNIGNGPSGGENGSPTYENTHTHTYGDYVSYSTDQTISCDQRTYYRTCSECGAVDWRTGDQHTYKVVKNAATCTHSGIETRTCTSCGKVQTTTLAITPHAYETTYRQSGSHHWFQCSNCDATFGREEHTEGENGICTVCKESIGPTEGITYLSYEDHAEVTGYTGDALKIVIADTFDGKPVTAIAANAFQEKLITSVYIPEGITKIGANAFFNCSKLSTVTIPTSVTAIGEKAFHYCLRLSSVIFVTGSRLNTIGDWAFHSCENLATVNHTAKRDHPWQVRVLRLQAPCKT
ncbi:MAG: leucine-rich repeat domain-containing protein [Clostridia bacterium]|nr:leucine-rich repeat domain-containing protein [Clostridia bacterium]